jgi:hypothetical protein
MSKYVVVKESKCGCKNVVKRPLKRWLKEKCGCKHAKMWL